MGGAEFAREFILRDTTIDETIILNLTSPKLLSTQDSVIVGTQSSSEPQWVVYVLGNNPKTRPWGLDWPHCDDPHCHTTPETGMRFRHDRRHGDHCGRYTCTVHNRRTLWHMPPPEAIVPYHPHILRWK